MSSPKPLPSFCAKLITSTAGTLPHRYFPPPKGLCGLLANRGFPNAGMRPSLSQHGRQLRFNNADLQVRLCSDQCAVWQGFPQYCHILLTFLDAGHIRRYADSTGSLLKLTGSYRTRIFHPFRNLARHKKKKKEGSPPFWRLL